MPIREMISASSIADRISWMGQAITKDFARKQLTFIPVLKGSFVFAGDLIRTVKLPDVFVDFLGISSYNGGTSSGSINIIHDLVRPIKGKDILLVEDIVDSGLTIQYLMNMLQAREPASISVCTLLHKSVRTRVPVKIDYTGFTIEDKFVVGYGMDYQEKYRSLPYVGEIQV
jgi:hypoxanthine phosphoribosyltransferase